MENGLKDILTLWKEIEVRLDVVLVVVVKNDAYISPKFITGERTSRTNFHGADIPFGNTQPTHYLNPT